MDKIWAAMDKIWADRIIVGTRALNEVPVNRKGTVKTILKNKVTPVRYSELVSEKGR